MLLQMKAIFTFSESLNAQISSLLLIYWYLQFLALNYLLKYILGLKRPKFKQVILIFIR